jgi:hypothetical protein
MNQFKKLKEEKEKEVAVKESDINVSISSISVDNDEDEKQESCLDKIKTGCFRKKGEKLMEEKEESVHSVKKKGL